MAPSPLTAPFILPLAWPLELEALELLETWFNPPGAAPSGSATADALGVVCVASSE